MPTIRQKGAPKDSPTWDLRLFRASEHMDSVQVVGTRRFAAVYAASELMGDRLADLGEGLTRAELYTGDGREYVATVKVTFAGH